MGLIMIDGSRGEGGGQILRTSLALSLLTHTPIRVENVRARRPKPGLMRQHLTAVQAAAEIGRADLLGAELGSTQFEFRPREIAGGDFHFRVGTAGSTTLVLQTVLPALLRASLPSTLILEGGTHNPLAPSFDYIDRVFLPLLRRMGASVEVSLQRAGFYPAGGGRFTVKITPGPLEPVDLPERGALRSRRARAIFSGLPFAIARRELDVLKARLDLREDECRPHEVTSDSVGNVLEVELISEHVTELFFSHGERGVSAETVAERVADEAAAYLASGAPVGAHLADQLLLPLALAGGGSFVTVPPTPHTQTQLETIARFLPVKMEVVPLDGKKWRLAVV